MLGEGYCDKIGNNGFSVPSYLVTTNVKLTPEGGIAVLLINDTGGPSLKGYIVEASSSTDDAVQYTTNDDIDPIGVVYEDAVPQGEDMWVVVSGIADVFYGTVVTRATFSRVSIVADGVATGQAVNEALPTPPFATNKHFQEIGHPIESRGTPGLAKTILHFN
jgi:hypothetical protein